MLKRGSDRVADIPRKRPAPEEAGFSWWPWLLGALVIVVLLFLAVPAYKGYGVYRAMRAADVPETYVADMEGLAGASAACTSRLDATQGELDSCTAGYAACSQDLNGQKALVESLGKDLSARGGELKSCEEISTEKDAAVADAARRICCVQKVENPAISGFSIVDGKIACVTDGGKAISC